MKKIIAIILVTLACVMTLASCTLTAPDAVKLAEKLDDAGYEVVLTVDKDAIDKSGITLEARSEYIEQILTVVSADEEDPKSGMFIYYSNTESAKAAVDVFARLLVEAEDYESDEVISQVVKSKGKIVYIGDEECWNEAFK